MPPIRRTLAGVIFCSSAMLATLVACGGDGFAPGGPLLGPAPSLAAARDLGRSAAHKPVRVVVLLRYNHAVELERFVDALERDPRPRYLSHRQFLERYAPTAQQEQRVLRALHHAGFNVTHHYANRLLIDATAPAETVERTFSTELHDFRQTRYGVRTANVRPLQLPATLAPDVAAVEANSLVLARNGMEDDRLSPLTNIKNVVQNGDFDTGRLAPWKNCGTVAASISSEHPKSKRYDALVGSTTDEVKGWSAICQRVTIPPNATLTAWLYQFADEPNEKRAYQEVALADASGNPTVRLMKTNLNTESWTRQTWDLSKYAGKSETLFFGVHGRGSKNFHDAFLVDNVSLTGVMPTPTPIPGLGPNGTWGPSIVAAGVSMPSTKGISGQGQTVAIVIAATVASSDLQAYLQYFNIPFGGTVSSEAVDGGGAPDTEGEATLDLETIVGLAPAANVIVYDTPDMTNGSIEDAYNQVASDAKATVINSSFGECEVADSAFTSLSESIALGASAQGVTFSASAGDAGAACPDGSGNFQAGQSAPASDPHFVAVGGTQSGYPTPPPYSGSQRSRKSATSWSIVNPVAWNDFVGAGGGGVSTVWTPPPYQQSLAGASSSGRNVPDIALPAVYDGLYMGGNWYQVWGTSWSSPIYVAMQSEINQACAKPQWGINTLYGAFAKTAYQSDFIDVTSGNNSFDGATGAVATTGFDNVSGIGIPLGSQIATDACGTR